MADTDFTLGYESGPVELWGHEEGGVFYRDERFGPLTDFDVTTEPELCAILCAAIRGYLAEHPELLRPFEEERARLKPAVGVTRWP